MSKRLPIVVLISGNGSNLQAMIDAMQGGAPFEIRAVISNHVNAYGLVRAQKAKIPTHVIEHQGFPTRDAFDNALRQQIDKYHPRLIVLAGFMRFLGSAFVAYYQDRIINIHPSLLPKYRGLHTHRRALAAGDKIHGITIHFVTDDLDNGPIICQATLQVHENDSEETLKHRIQALEHKIYPQVIEWFANNRLALHGNQVELDGKLLPKNGLML